MNPVRNILKTQKIVVLDGAMATQLEVLGCNLSDSLWSAKILLESPDKITAVHRQYLEAGADCIITSSYQATVQGFMQRGLTEKEAVDLLKLSAQLAVDERDRFWEMQADTSRCKPLVAASIGSYGAYLANGAEYTGDFDLTKKQLMDFHRPRLQILAESHVDLFAFETIPSLLEAQVLCALLQEFPNAQAYLAFSCKDGLHTCYGDTIRECVQSLEAYDQIIAIGVNCTAPEHITSLVSEIKTVSPDRCIVIYPNLGGNFDHDEKRWKDTPSSVDFSAKAKTWFEHGATIIGGCCRTGPQEIQALSSWAKSHS